MKRIPEIDGLPWFVDDRTLGQALLGTARASEWPSLVPLYEREGFPAVDPILGARYVPAIRAFFDKKYGLASTAPKAPDGIERPDRWNAPKRRA